MLIPCSTGALPGVRPLQVNAAGADPFARMAKLMALNDADVRDVLKMQCVVAAHVQGGGRLETLLPPVTNDAAGPGSGPSSTNQLHSFLSGGGGMGAPPGAGGGAPAPKTTGHGKEEGHGHDHSHGHGHVHGPHCNHGSHEKEATATGESAGASHSHDHSHAHAHAHASDDSNPAATPPPPPPSAEPSGPDAVLAAVLKETNGQGFDLDHQHQHSHAVPADDAPVPPSKEGLGSKTPDVAFGIAPSMNR